MKKINKLTLLILFTIVLSSCDSFLSQDPQSSLSPTTFWKTKEDANLWLAGTYDAVQATVTTCFQDWGEFRADNWEPQSLGTGSQRLVYNNSLSASGMDSQTSWANLYKVISRCNYGLKYLPPMIAKNVDGNADTYRDNMGQYYGLRALMYFYAVRVWGRVPLLGDTPIETLNQVVYKGRSSIDSVKIQIQNDVDSCLKYVNITDKKFYISIGAAYALKADVHMWFKEYNLAEAAIQKFEALNLHKWIATPDDWKKIFTQPDVSTETIFSINFNSILDAGASSRIGWNLGSSDYAATWAVRPAIWQELYNRNHNLPGVKDIRWNMCFDTITYTVPLSPITTRVLSCGKFFNWDPTMKVTGRAALGGFVLQPANLCDAAIPIYRYADVELMKAELLCRKADYTGALTIVNAVRKRVGYNVTAAVGDFTIDLPSQVIDCIMNERKYELLGEGKRWFDLIRVSNASLDYFHKIMDAEVISRPGCVDFLGTNEQKILFPISSGAFSANPSLRGDQNQPYSE